MVKEMSKEILPILDALGKDYMNMCLLDLENETTQLINVDGTIDLNIQKEWSYYQMCHKSISKYVSMEKRKELEEAVDLNKVAREIALHQKYSIVFEVIMDEKKCNCQIKYIHLNDSKYILMCFKMIDTNQEMIRKNAEELKKEKMFLDVLCKDYTSVFYLDLNNDQAELLKMAEDTNISKMLKNYTREKMSYSEKIKDYCQRYVSTIHQEEFLKIMDRKNLMEKLSQVERFVYQYQSVPNKKGHIYFEVQVVRIDSVGFENTAILGFRDVHDIILLEQQHQHVLEETIQKVVRSNEILQTMSKIYYSIFIIDLEKDEYEEVGQDYSLYHLTGKTGCASYEMKKLCQNIVVEEYQERIMQFFDISTLAKRLENEETIATEYLAQDGNWHTARFIVKRRNDLGQVTHVLYVTRVISDEKRREQNWIAIAKEANEANKAKSDFLRRMSHDIRTPINGILGMIEMENRHADDIEKLQECRNKILNATEYLYSIVNNVLDIKKLETDGFVLEHKSFDLIPLLMKQVNLLMIETGENGINFYGGKEMSVIKHRYLIGSPNHLHRILMNLASNAIKYNKRGGSITLYCKEIKADDIYATYQFICQDTGLGMSKEYQKHAFEPFTQEGKGSLSSYNGSGLGLSIVKDIVEKMNGEIEFTSEENVGTTFIVTIPFEIDHHAIKQNQQLSKEKKDVTGKKALLVEDNELNREIAKMLLEDEGLIVTTVQNGQEAIEVYKRSLINEFDYIFMDIVMPVMDGILATKIIRSMDREDAKTIPILAMSANAFQDDIQQSLQVGMNEHLVKPLDVDKLKMAIQRVTK